MALIHIALSLVALLTLVLVMPAAAAEKEAPTVPGAMALMTEDAVDACRCLLTRALGVHAFHLSKAADSDAEADAGRRAVVGKSARAALLTPALCRIGSQDNHVYPLCEPLLARYGAALRAWLDDAAEALAYSPHDAAAAEAEARAACVSIIGDGIPISHAVSHAAARAAARRPSALAGSAFVADAASATPESLAAAVRRHAESYENHVRARIQETHAANNARNYGSLARGDMAQASQQMGHESFDAADVEKAMARLAAARAALAAVHGDHDEL